MSKVRIILSSKWEEKGDISFQKSGGRKEGVGGGEVLPRLPRPRPPRPAHAEFTARGSSRLTRKIKGEAFIF